MGSLPDAGKWTQGGVSDPDPLLEAARRRRPKVLAEVTGVLE